MNDKNYSQFQDDIFQQLRDLEDIARKREYESAIERLRKAAEPLAKAIGVDVEKFMRMTFENPEKFITALSSTLEESK